MVDVGPESTYEEKWEYPLGSGPASTVHPKKYQEFQAPQKIFEILAPPKNIPYSVPWP